MTALLNLLRMAIVLFSLIFIVSLPAKAEQHPKLMVTWEANSYVPPAYLGKALPSSGSVISLAIELIDNGKFVDISENEIRWLINNRSLQSGKGLKKITVEADRFRNSQEILVTVTKYAGSDIQKIIRVPVVVPQVEVALPGTNNTITPGVHKLEIFPYFFDVDSLKQIKITWLVGGKISAGTTIGSKIELDTRNVSTGTTVSLDITAENSLNKQQIVEKSINLLIQE